jgi:hypothetical protein
MKNTGDLVVNIAPKELSPMAAILQGRSQFKPSSHMPGKLIAAAAAVSVTNCVTYPSSILRLTYG